MKAAPLLILLMLPFCALAQEPADTADSVSEETETRIAPEMENPTVTDSGIGHDSYARYRFLNLAANRIQLNGRDWSRMSRILDAAGRGDTTFTVVHIGDSHIQADGNTGRVRRNIQQRYGNAGRGLMAPLRIAGTNQPVDFKFTTTAPVTRATLMRMPWATAVGFTGIAVQPDSRVAPFMLSTDQPFDVLRIYGRGEFDVTDVNGGAEFTWTHTPYGGEIVLDRPVMKLDFDITGTGYRIFGVDARMKDAAGVLYHNIGNNGATYGTYSLVGEVGAGVKGLGPKLVIISLGTNEAFGRTSDESMYNQIDRLVREIRETNPQAEILLTTPSECQRSVVTRKRVARKRRKGRKRRYRTVRTRSYTVNTNVARMRDVILRYGRDNNIPTYDFYEVAGGKGSSARWLGNGLLSRDRIHRTWSGYYLEGELLSDALLKALAPPGQ